MSNRLILIKKWSSAFFIIFWAGVACTSIYFLLFQESIEAFLPDIDGPKKPVLGQVSAINGKVLHKYFTDNIWLQTQIDSAVHDQQLYFIAENSSLELKGNDNGHFRIKEYSMVRVGQVNGSMVLDIKTGAVEAQQSRKASEMSDVENEKRAEQGNISGKGSLGKSGGRGSRSNSVASSKGQSRSQHKELSREGVASSEVEFQKQSENEFKRFDRTMEYPVPKNGTYFLLNKVTKIYIVPKYLCGGTCHFKIQIVKPDGSRTSTTVKMANQQQPVVFYEFGPKHQGYRVRWSLNDDGKTIEGEFSILKYSQNNLTRTLPLQVPVEIVR